MTYAELLPDGMKAEMRRFVRDVAKHGIIDVVEVVRCKDCKYMEDDGFCFHFMFGKTVSDGYCAWGERREEG